MSSHLFAFITQGLNASHPKQFLPFICSRHISLTAASFFTAKFKSCNFMARGRENTKIIFVQYDSYTAVNPKTKRKNAIP